MCMFISMSYFLHSFFCQWMLRKFHICLFKQGFKEYWSIDCSCNSSRFTQRWDLLSQMAGPTKKYFETLSYHVTKASLELALIWVPGLQIATAMLGLSLSFFNFWRKLHSVFHSGCTTEHSGWCSRVSFPSHFTNICYSLLVL